MKYLPSLRRRIASARRTAPEGGFTLVELLVVLVVLPLIIGAAAEAVIVSLENSSSTAKRLSDSASAQITAAFFNSDVQGASLISIDQNAADLPTDATASATAPEYCPKTAPVAGATSIVQLYRPSPTLSVGYWLQGSASSAKVIRYSCSVSSFRTTQTSSLTVADVPIPTATTGPLTGSASISPSQFQSPAQAGWAPTAASTFATSNGALASLTTIAVESTVGFTAGTVIVNTTLGPQLATCTSVVSATKLACTSTAGGFVEPFVSSVTQSTVSSVQILVSEPGSSYTYQVKGSPRSGAGGPVPIPNPPPSLPTLLTLGSSGISIAGGGNSQCTADNKRANICVSGTALVNNGDISCPTGTHFGIDTPTLELAGGGSTTGNCTATGVKQVTDPIAPNLPPICFGLTSGLSLPMDPPLGSGPGGTTIPGIYTATALSGTLEPGIYVAEAGTGTISMASDDHSLYWKQNTSGTDEANSGALIYIPGTAGAYPSQCATYQPPAGTPPSISPTGQQASAIQPLSNDQSTYWFSGSTTEADMWLWQDGANTTSPTLHGNDWIDAACGLMYMPNAQIISTDGTPNITTGKLLVGGISISGGGNGTITLTGC